jgi:hypothetical protein
VREPSEEGDEHAVDALDVVICDDRHGAIRTECADDRARPAALDGGSAEALAELDQHAERADVRGVGRDDDAVVVVGQPGRPGVEDSVVKGDHDDASAALESGSKMVLALDLDALQEALRTHASHRREAHDALRRKTE